VHIFPGRALHVPVASHVRSPEQVSSSAFLTGTQVPPVPVHAWQLPHVAEPQQWPSMQLPETQYTSLLHSIPLGNLSSQAPAVLQNWVDRQTVPPATSQPFAQRVWSAQPPEQATAVMERQPPARSQAGAPLAMPF
jgi:hypothetical protein